MNPRERFDGIERILGQHSERFDEIDKSLAELKSDNRSIQDTLAFLVEHAMGAEERMKRHTEMLLEHFRSDLRALREDQRYRLDDHETRIRRLEDAS